MKKQIFLVLSLIVLVGAVSVIPSIATTYTPFNSITSGDEIHWTVLNFNETSNNFQATTWLSEFYVPKGKYVLNIGDNIKFTVDNPAACIGTIQIGNLTVNSVTRHEFGLNLMLVTGPASPPFSNYSWDPALISPTNWAYQIDLANNATNERGASLSIDTYNMTFLGVSRAVQDFYFTYGLQISKAIYDTETGLLLYMYIKFMNLYFELEITTIQADGDDIPSFGLMLSILGLSLVIIVLYRKRKAPTILRCK
ncbi:MAG: hypothetical protein HWN66_10050 [Candidatus Helarchaeota archaeon]|nr:hypothetical protein [Candidatus Helarchaeota archaeon]